MATLQKIRNRAGLLIAIVIGIALLAFLLGDFLSSGNVAFKRSQLVIAKINGTSVYYNEYFDLERDKSNYLQLYYNMSSVGEQLSMEAKRSAWNDLLNKYIQEKEYEEIGLSVHPVELFDWLSGDNPPQVVRQSFTDPETNIFNQNAFINFLQAIQMGDLEENENLRTQRELWLYLEDELLKDKLREKYNYLFNKGIYTTSFEIQETFKENNGRFAFSFVGKRFVSVSDSAVKVTDSDIKKYYNENIDQYQNKEESRSIEYVIFKVVPSAEDDEDTRKWIENLKPEFEKIEDVRLYVNANSDTDKPYDPTNYKRDELPEIYRDVLFDAPEGTVFGPYVENGSYKMAKLAKVNYLPDSIKARQIFIQADGNTSYDALKTKADSLLLLIKNGMRFGNLAEAISHDPVSAEVGGDLGWFKENQMVNQTVTKKVIDSCFIADLNKPTIVSSQYGLHIIEVTKQSPKTKKVQIGVIERKVEPSTSTEQEFYGKALKFAGENNTYEKFKQAVNKESITSNVAQDLKKGDLSVMGMENSREIVKWAFNSELNAVSEEVFELNNNFIVAGLFEINEEGAIPIEKVKNDIIPSVIMEKKGEYLKKQMEELAKSENSIENIANKLGTEVVEAGEMSFASLPMLRNNFGLEPEVVAVASLTDEGKIAGPIVGKNGVYIIKVESKTAAGTIDESDINYYKWQNNKGQGLRDEAAAALRDMAELEDNRTNFF